jgi:hypothetical protein
MESGGTKIICLPALRPGQTKVRYVHCSTSLEGRRLVQVDLLRPFRHSLETLTLPRRYVVFLRCQGPMMSRTACLLGAAQRLNGRAVS